MDTFLELVEIGVVAVYFYIVGPKFFAPTDEKYEEMNVEKIARDAINGIAEQINNLSILNIMVAGKTGVGKSTLINAVFKEHLADMGMGKPVTTYMRKITKKDVPLAIYDTRGFELG